MRGNQTEFNARYLPQESCPDEKAKIPAQQQELEQRQADVPVPEASQGTETLPRLAGQHARYTERQLKLFEKRERTNDNAVMHTVAAKLTELEIKAVASYVSGLQ